MSTLSTYIAYDGATEEALTLYRDIFGGELNILKYGDMPPMEGMPFEPDPGAVAHAQLDLPGGTITASDAMPGEQLVVKGTVYSLLYDLDDVNIANDCIEKLVAAGGAINMPFEPAPWGGHYGQVFDKFGVMWAFNVDPKTGEATAG
ncbi:VOC family protein [Micrococcoides hystricis]|uniref:VOC family protein n=1 Tax=Micrococcoides hystricis TaxID=1572761 RepID=A0ABV6PA34_9MICC